MSKIWTVVQHKEYEIKADSADEAWSKWMDSDWLTVLEEEPETCTLFDQQMNPVNA
jgi:hypothetical protein